MSLNRQTPVRISFNWIFVGLLAVVFGLALWQVRSILMLTFAAIVLVIAFSIPIRWLMRLPLPLGKGEPRGMSRGLAILLTLVGSVILIGLMFLLVMPTLAAQFATLFNDVVPRGVQQFLTWVESEETREQFAFIEPFVSEINADTLNQAASQVLSALGQVGGSVLPLVGGLANTLFSFIIVLFISLYLLSDPDLYIRRIIKYTPVAYRGRMAHILGRMDTAIRAWWWVSAVTAVVAAVLTGVGLAALGIREWAALGVLTGIASFIPNFGPLLALIPAAAVGLVQAPDSLLGIVLVVYGVSFIQSQLIAPILANESMQLPPVLILVGQVVFGIFFGFLGIMFAVPITAVLLLLVDEIYVRDILGDTSEMPVSSAPAQAAGSAALSQREI